MKRLHLDKDILPLSEFRANAASIIEKVKTGHRPLVITQHGKSSAILLDVSDYEKMVDTIETLQEVSQARQELEEGKGVPHHESEDAWSDELKKRIDRYEQGKSSAKTWSEVKRNAQALLYGC